MMAENYLTETTEWVDGVYQIETDDPVVGGPDGISNRQAKELASRTKYLRDAITALADKIVMATANAAGIVKLSTVAEAKTGANAEKAVTPAGLKAVIDGIPIVPPATVEAAGIVKLSTVAEAKTGADAEKAVTPAGLKAAMDTLPIVPPGTVIYFAGVSPPPGYMKANGGLRSRTVYATLFGAIGTTYGAGDGATTFGIPDLRGEFIRSWDDGRGVDAGRVLGSAQSGTHITGDNDDSPSIHGIGHIDECNIDKPDGIARSVFLGGVQSTTVMAGYWGMTRPRNVALLACIKY